MKLSIPLIQSVDVLLLGGTVSGCRAALELKKKGFSVFAATPFSYFGEDLCAPLDLHGGDRRRAELTQRGIVEADHPDLFGNPISQSLGGLHGDAGQLVIASENGVNRTACKTAPGLKSYLFPAAAAGDHIFFRRV